MAGDARVMLGTTGYIRQLIPNYYDVVVVVSMLIRFVTKYGYFISPFTASKRAARN